MKNKLVVLDDVEDYSRGFAEKLAKLNGVKLPFEVQPLPLKDFRDGLEVLGQRERDVREGKSVKFEGCVFDEAAVSVVDFELPKVFDAPFSMNGEDVCYLLRCYSGCGTLVGVDKYITLGDSPFDLTLHGDPDSFADVNVTGDQLANPALWGGSFEFRPWYWPNVVDAPARLEATVEHIGKSLDAPLGEVFGFPDLLKRASNEARRFVGSKPEEVTPRQFVEESGKGIRGRTEKATDKMIARIAGARLSKWFERLVLPGQDVLVDAPHLVSRYPSLLVNDPANRDSWDATAALLPHDRVGLRFDGIEQHRFKTSAFLSRPVWVAANLGKDKTITEVADPFSRSTPPYVFAEDASRFYPEGECLPFKANVDSPYVRRFVKQFKGVEYTPIDNLEM